MDNFDLNESMNLKEAYVGPMIDAIYHRLMERDFSMEHPEVVILLAALPNILGHDNRGDRLWTTKSTRPSKHQGNEAEKWALSGRVLANYCEVQGPTNLVKYYFRSSLGPFRGIHQEFSSEAASSSSQLRAAVLPKRRRVEEEVQTNETVKDLNETKDELERMRKTLLRTEEEREMCRGLFEN